jgi:hypothetical protein
VTGRKRDGNGLDNNNKKKKKKKKKGKKIWGEVQVAAGEETFLREWICRRRYAYVSIHLAKLG